MSHGVWKSHKKSHFTTLRAKWATLTYWIKMTNLATFRKTEVCGKTVLPDKSISIGQKLVENAKTEKKLPDKKCYQYNGPKLVKNAKIEKFKWDIFGWFSNNVLLTSPLVFMGQKMFLDLHSIDVDQGNSSIHWPRDHVIPLDSNPPHWGSMMIKYF